MERAARKEAEFKEAVAAVNEAWERIEREAAKAGLQIGAILLMKRGRISSAGLQAAMAERDRAKAETTRLRDAEVASIFHFFAPMNDFVRQAPPGKPVVAVFLNLLRQACTGYQK